MLSEKQARRKRRVRDIPMRAWEDRTQVVFILLGVQLAALIVAALLIFLSRLLSTETDPSSLFLQTGVIMIAFTVGGTVTAGFILADRMSNRLRQMVELVDKQIEISELDIEQAPGNLPEVIYLAQTLDKLGIAYKHSLDSIKHRVEELSAIKTIAESINQTLNLQDVIDLSLKEILKIFNWQAGAIYIWEEDPGSFTMVSFQGFMENAVKELIFLDQENALVKEVVGGKLKTTAKCLYPGSSEEMALRLVPLMALSEQMLGLLMIADSEKKGLLATEERLYETFAHQVSLAMDKARLHAELSVYARKLESLVAERTQQLNEAISELWESLKKAQEAERMKSLLLSTVSHELRTPLMTIKGNISLLSLRHAQMDIEQMKPIFIDIEDDTDKLTELITNLLELSRIEGGMLQINAIEIDLTGVIQAAVNSARVRIKDHPIQMADHEGGLTVIADPRRMEQVIANLIDNAAKYSPQGEDIRVVMGRDDGWVRVGVIDRGQGVREADKERIFERFVQLNARGDSQHHQGVGLGLAICRGLVEAHHGKIWVESEWGEGAAFYFSLPGAEAIHGDEERK